MKMIVDTREPRMTTKRKRKRMQMMMMTKEDAEENGFYGFYGVIFVPAAANKTIFIVYR